MTQSRTRFSQRSGMWHGHFGVGLIDSQAQWVPTLIGQRWSTISASTRYPRLNPLWLVTHSTLSHTHHSFQSHVYHLARVKIATFFVQYFIIQNCFIPTESPAQNHYHIVSFSGVVVWPKWQKIGKIIRYFVAKARSLSYKSLADK